MTFKPAAALLMGVMTFAPLSLGLVSPAVAQTQAAISPKVSQYRELMKLNGTAPNMLDILNAQKPQIIEYLEGSKGSALTDADKARLDAIAARIFPEAAEAVTVRVATIQSDSLTDTEIDGLIKLAGTPAARRFYAAKYAEPGGLSEETREILVAGVLDIIKGVQNPSASLTSVEPADSRTQSVLNLLKLEGTEAYRRVMTEQYQMQAIMAEVGNNIDLTTLSEAETARLETVKTGVAATITERLLRLDARPIAAALSDQDIAQLTQDFANPLSIRLVDIRFEGVAQYEAEMQTLLEGAINKVAEAYEAGEA